MSKSNETKKLALQEIDEQLKIMKTALREAQRLADEHGLKFKFALDVPVKNPDRYNNSVEGKYLGKGSEEVYEGEAYPQQGEWYWENSSLNC